MYYLLFCIIGIIIGLLISYLANKINTIYGILIINDEEESYFFHLSTEEIKNPKNKRIIFNIDRGNSTVDMRFKKSQ